MEDLPIIPVVYLLRLIELMERESIGVNHILRDCGIGSALLSTPEACISLRQLKALIGRFSGLSSQAFPGLRYGFELDSVTHGLIGYLIVNRGHCRDLLTAIVDYMKVRLPVTDLNIVHKEDYFSIVIRCHSGLQEYESFIVQTLMGSLYTQGSMLTRNISVHFTDTALPDARGLRSFMPVDIVTGCDSNEIRFHASEQAESGDEITHDALTTDSLPLQETGIILSLRGYLLARAGEAITIEHAANHLGLSVRTLRRRLEGSGMSFTQIRLDVRMQWAVRYLKTSDISLDRIATLIGYSDQASFTRAFRDWSGKTPLSMRQHILEKRRKRSSDETEEPIVFQKRAVR